MSEKTEALKGHRPRTLSASEIRTLVEEIAEDLALRMREGQPEQAGSGLEAFALDNRRFIKLMTDYVRMN